MKANRELLSTAKGEVHASQAALQVWAGQQGERWPNLEELGGIYLNQLPLVLPLLPMVTPSRVGLVLPKDHFINGARGSSEKETWQDLILSHCPLGSGFTLCAWGFLFVSDGGSIKPLILSILLALYSRILFYLYIEMSLLFMLLTLLLTVSSPSKQEIQTLIFNIGCFWHL